MPELKLGIYSWCVVSSWKRTELEKKNCGLLNLCGYGAWNKTDQVSFLNYIQLNSSYLVYKSNGIDNCISNTIKIPSCPFIVKFPLSLTFQNCPSLLCDHTCTFSRRSYTWDRTVQNLFESGFSAGLMVSHNYSGLPL